MRANIAILNRIAVVIVGIAAAILWVEGRAAANDPSLVLASSASEAPPEGVVTIVLAGSNLPEGATITLTPPLKGELWVGAPDCESPNRSTSLISHATMNALLCLTSKKRQSVRAIVTVSLVDHLLVARSEPVKFYSEHWWSSPGFLTVFTTLLGAAAGVAGTLVTQRAEHSRKIKDETKALENAQAAFVVKLLLPELANHVTVLTTNRGVQAGQERTVLSLPRTNLITIVDSARAKSLKSYFDAQGNQSVVDQLTDYNNAANEYNECVQGVKRETQSLATLSARGEIVMEKLKSLGIAG